MKRISKKFLGVFLLTVLSPYSKADFLKVGKTQLTDEQHVHIANLYSKAKNPLIYFINFHPVNITICMKPFEVNGPLIIKRSGKCENIIDFIISLASQDLSYSNLLLENYQDLSMRLDVLYDQKYQWVNQLQGPGKHYLPAPIANCNAETIKGYIDMSKPRIYYPNQEEKIRSADNEQLVSNISTYTMEIAKTYDEIVQLGQKCSLDLTKFKEEFDYAINKLKSFRKNINQYTYVYTDHRKQHIYFHNPKTESEDESTYYIRMSNEFLALLKEALRKDQAF
jgi:hypothetical protein